MTNYQKVKNMTIEEMAEALDCSCCLMKGQCTNSEMDKDFEQLIIHDKDCCYIHKLVWLESEETN